MLIPQENGTVLTEAMKNPKPGNCSKNRSDILSEFVRFHEPEYRNANCVRQLTDESRMSRNNLRSPAAHVSSLGLNLSHQPLSAIEA
jgi:hypothetical protein